jgi:hypothetical protein
MAANIQTSCNKCGKTGVILLCNGCNKTLCFKHVNEHKEELEKELEDLINKENEFENNLCKIDDSHYLFNEIDQWKKESIEQIKQIAKQAKQDLRLLINQSNQKLIINSQKIKEELLLLKQSEDLSEIKLIKLINQFNDLKKEINSFQLIKSSNSIFLKVEKQQTYEIPRSKTPTIIPYNEKHSPYIEQTHSKREG